MKYIIIFFLFIAQTTVAQLSPAGFNNIKLGSSYGTIKSEIIEIETVPHYAHFAPMSIEYFLESSGKDSSAYFEMLETDRLIAESLDTKIVRCTFKKKKNSHFFEFPIECVQLVFNADKLIGISLVFDKRDMSELAKDQIIEQFESELGDGLKHHNKGNPLPRFERKWKSGNQEITISDKSRDDQTAESLNILFGQY